ncbi:nucleotidyltransferase family protein [Ruegeria sp. R13_0]|uniref:nucleotidyltransferase family protein n=1 Tax=Ruegeria sp. R13_0 TaxID=2821099 RepID=UPI001AD95915|nr:nucleotidyltransferase family protein [Ruegeria sp. R13_0]MBO9434397.1 nucleotidyltransferase family protein [Ruegeria sp. R13_0]
MSQSPDAVMLFAAGFGTRMGALTKDLPKPLIEVAGRPLIDHALALVDAVHPSRVVANLHYHADQLQAHLAPKGILLSHETPEILETGGGLRAALPLLGTGPVFTMNTDAIWAGPNPLSLLQRAWDPDRMDALLMCVPIGQTIGHAGEGDFTADADGRITRGPGLVYGGVQILKTDGLHHIPEQAFSLNLLWNQMHDRKRLFALKYPGRWCDVGRPEGIALAEGMLADV